MNLDRFTTLEEAKLSYSDNQIVKIINEWVRLRAAAIRASLVLEKVSKKLAPGPLVKQATKKKPKPIKLPIRTEAQADKYIKAVGPATGPLGPVTPFGDGQGERSSASPINQDSQDETVTAGLRHLDPMTKDLLKDGIITRDEAIKLCPLEPKAEGFRFGFSGIGNRRKN